MNERHRIRQGGIAAVATLAVVLTACSGAQPSGRATVSTPPSSQTSEPVPPGPSSAAPSAAPSTSAPSAPAPSADTTGGFPADSFVEVVTDGLRVRAKPGTGADSLKLEPLLWNGAIAMVLAGPVAASGYDWYLLELMAEVDIQVHPDPPAFGWVAAAGKDGEAWLARLPVDCYESPLGWLAYELHQPPMELAALSCFGASTRSFVAQLGRFEPGCEDAVDVVDPAWLDPCAEPSFALAPEDGPGPDGFRFLGVAIHPDAGAEALPPFPAGHWLIVNVEGQYDHPAAAGCEPSPPDPALPPEVASLGCRSRFVVTSISVYFDE